MSMFEIGIIIDSAGKILVGLTVLFVHRHVLKEHRIDGDVLRAMKREQGAGIVGLLLIAAGSIIQLLGL